MKAMIVCVALWSAAILTCDAETIRSKDGTVYEGATVSRVDHDGITVVYSDGVGKIPTKFLPDDLAAKYGTQISKLNASYAAIKKARDDADAKAKEKAEEITKAAQEQENKRLQDEQEAQRASEMAAQKEAEETRAAEAVKIQAAADAYSAKQTREKTVLISVIIIGALFYFLPSIQGRNKLNSSAIFYLNLFLGWTFVGWVVALVWACTKDEPRRT